MKKNQENCFKIALILSMSVICFNNSLHLLLHWLDQLFQKFIIQMSSDFLQSLYHLFLNHFIIADKSLKLGIVFMNSFFKMSSNVLNQIEIQKIERSINHFNLIISKLFFDNVCCIYWSFILHINQARFS